MQSLPTIAIVDDDDGVRASLSSLVRSLGYQVRVYPSAPALLEDGQAPPPACVISDLQMPAMSGEQLQAALIAAGHAWPMIFITAFPSEATRTRVLAHGARAFLDKPVDGTAIAGLLAGIVAQDPATRAR